MIGKTVSHYKILGKLGEGGMGVVYKAEDTKLERTVAIKFLPHQIAANSEERERFKIEAKAAAALNHPNIATIHAIEEHNDELFIVMEYIEGQELRELLANLAKVEDLRKILDLATQIASGLEAAHKKGIIHRDIKSANIMVTDKGVVKIMDFGLAKVRGGAQFTKVGTTLGTAAYMSPEQARGEKVDHRTDIWAFGVVLYEMLTGKLPFPGDYEQAVIYSVLNEEPQAISEIRDDIPADLAQLVQKTLKKDVDERYQSMYELLQDLKPSPTSDIKSPNQEKSIVVLPFENMSPDPDQEYFSDGLTEEIISDLSQIHDLLVISRSSAMTFKGTKKKIKEIAKEVNVRYVLEGSVRKAGNNLRITAQLIDANNDSHLWAEKYKGTLEDVFDIQEKVSRSIVDALRLKLSSAEKQRVARRPIDNVQAYDCYLRARQEIQRFTEDALDRAVKHLQTGLDILGDNALLYAGMAYVYYQYANIGIKQDESIGKAEEYVQKAFELDAECQPAHMVLGAVNQAFRGNQQLSINHFKRALAIDPNDFDTLFWLSLGYALVGKTSAAIPLLERLMDIEPLNPLSYGAAALIHVYDGRFDLAVEPISKALRMESENAVIRILYAFILAYNGRDQEAWSAIDQMTKVAPDHYWSQLGLFLKLAMKGEKKQVSQFNTPGFIKTSEADPQYSCFLASFYSLLGERTQALKWLENAVNRGFINYPYLSQYDPFLENLRGDERFNQLMERVKHEWEHFQE